MNMTVHVALLALSLLASAVPAAGSRVRSSHPYIRAMIAEAQVRSATFRRLVSEIEATDGIVYVEEGDCHHQVRACVPPFVTTTGQFRFLRVLVDARQQDWQVMSDIGHELQHALEVLKEASARTDIQVFNAMSRESFGSSEVRETRDAIRAGDAVEDEVRAFARSSSTRGMPRGPSSPDS
jgi:hypothetical protein